DAGRLARSGDARAVHAGVRQSGAREPAEAVVADVADHAHRSTGPGGGGRLIGALAAGGQLVVRAQHRLAGARQGLDLEQQIDVDRAEHQKHSRALPAAGAIAVGWTSGPYAACAPPFLPRPPLPPYLTALAENGRGDPRMPETIEVCYVESDAVACDGGC